MKFMNIIGDPHHVVGAQNHTAIIFICRDVLLLYRLL